MKDYCPYPSGEALDFGAVSARYQQALDLLLEKLRDDEQVLAAILEGSMAYDKVWYKSDIDICIIVKDQKLLTGDINLTELGVIFSVSVMQRTSFCRMMEGALTGGTMHSIMRKGKIVYLRDETLARYLEDIEHVGDRDRDMMYLDSAASSLGALDKAEKWLYMKKDPVYSHHWLIYALVNMAGLEVLSHNDVPMREVLQQAMEYNPEFFVPIYRGLSQQEKTHENMREALAACRLYLQRGAKRYFKLILDYLRDEADARSTGDLVRDFSKKGIAHTHIFFEVMEYMVELGLCEKLTLPKRLTPKSHAEYEEASYIYMPDAGGDI